MLTPPQDLIITHISPGGAQRRAWTPLSARHTPRRIGRAPTGRGANSRPVRRCAPLRNAAEPRQRSRPVGRCNPRSARWAFCERDVGNAKPPKEKRFTQKVTCGIISAMKKRRRILAGFVTALLMLGATASFGGCGTGTHGAGYGADSPATHACCQQGFGEATCQGAATLAAGHAGGTSCRCPVHQPSQSEAALPAAQGSEHEVVQCAEALPPAPPESVVFYRTSALVQPPQTGPGLLLKAATGLRSPPAA